MNVAPGLVSSLAAALGVEVADDDLLTYVVATVSHPAFTERFADELTTPGVGVPLTSDRAVVACSRARQDGRLAAHLR